MYNDHTGASRQRLWAHLDAQPHRWNILSGVDILLGDAESGMALLVLEIEETACSPKKLLGDILALALAEHVTTESDDRPYAITPETELWVCYPANPRGHQRPRNRRLLAQLSEAWGAGAPLPRIRLVEADHPATLEDAVTTALEEWAGVTR